MVGRGGRQRIPRPPTIRPGRPSPWAHVPADRRSLGLDAVRERLADLPPPSPPDIAVPGSRDAAVLLPLFEEAGEARLILTKRPDTMPSHRGEIAFPGGKLDVGDVTLEAAALRETYEEIGIDPVDIEVVGELDALGTVGSRFTITPFVGLLEGRPELHPDPVEVARVFDVPLSALLADGVHSEEEWEVGLPDFTIQFFELDDETVWGATARILTRFLAHLVAD